MSTAHAVQVMVGDRKLDATARLCVNHMVLETAEALGFGTEARVRLGAIEIPVTVRWPSTNGVAVQYGALRARDVWSMNRLARA